MGEELEIKIGEELWDDLPFEPPHLPRRRHRVWGDPEQDDVRIIFGQKAYENVNQHACSEPNREVGGVLLGRAYRHEGVVYVEITETIPASLTRTGAAHVTFTPDTWSAVNREKEEHFSDLRIVGWYHTHPRMNIFLSRDDVFLHQNFFSEPWQIALVVEPHKHYGGFFIWKGTAVRPASGFYELFDSVNKSIVNWRNLLRPIPAPVPTREQIQRVAVVALVILVLGLCGLSVQMRSSLNRLQSELVELRVTAQIVGRQVDEICRKIDTATAIAQAMAATQTASVHATKQVRAAEKATATAVVATQAAAAQATLTALEACATQTAQTTRATGTAIAAQNATATAQAVSATQTAMEARATQTAQARATTTAALGATATAEALTATLQPELTATPQITATVSPTPVVTHTPTATPIRIPLIVSEGLSVKQSGQELGDGAKVLRDRSVEFTFTVQNTGAISITTVHLGVLLIHDDDTEFFPLEPDEPFEFPAGKERDFTLTRSFEEIGEYTAYVVVQMGDLISPVEVPAAKDCRDQITFSVQ